MTSATTPVRPSPARRAPTRRRGRTVTVSVVALVALVALAVPVAGAVDRASRSGAAGVAGTAVLAPVPGTGAPRPRILYEPGQEVDLRSRLDREPYRTIFLRSHEQTRASWGGATLGDLTIGNQRILLRAAQVRSFEYALDRTVVAGQIVPFPSADARQQAGDDARNVLLQMIDRSRLAVPAPIGGWDRDITTSEEIVASATAFDTLLGAGYPFAPDDRAEIVRRIAAVTGELHTNFVRPETASHFANFHQNNHRSKSGAAMAVAAVVLADEVDDARAWFDTGADYVDDVLRYMLVTGDGAYAEGPFYFRYTTQNLAVFLRTWERHLGSAGWTTAAGLVVPALGRHPLLERNLRWMLDTSVPDGTMAPIDDGNPGRSHFYGVLPAWLGATAAGYWQWARTPQPYDVDGNLALGPLAIASYDDRVAPAPPDWDPSQVYVEGGTATMRSGWGADDAMALVLGEHDTASEFGRDRLGLGRFPQSHEHAEPGAFLFHAYGERLALDPGYLTFTTHQKVNRPEHHNVVLVDGAGPPDYLQASVDWSADLLGRPPAEGQSTLANWVASDVGDAVTVASAYRGARLQRRVLFGGERYLVVADEVTAPAGTDLTWMLHGNGGGTSGGTYERVGAGGRWTIGGARLDSGIAVSGAAPALSESTAIHEVPYTVERTHTALAATTTAATGSTSAVQVLYPTRAGQAAPEVERHEVDGHPAITVTDAAAGRRVTTVRRGTGAGPLTADGVVADGSLLVVERTTAGALVSVWADDATAVTHGGAPFLTSATRGTLALRLDGGDRDLVAATSAPEVELRGDAAPGGAVAVDGGCGVDRSADTVVVRLNRTRTATLRATGGPGGRPAADAGPDRRVAAGTALTLDGRSSCDPEGRTLTPRWELVSAPAGSAWSLAGADGWSPVLAADRPGPFRVRLVVTDPSGNVSAPEEVLVKVGPQCADGVDDDLDGLIDTDDPDCDGPPSPPPPTTPAPGPTRPPGSVVPTPVPPTTAPSTTRPVTPGPNPTASERLVTLLFRDVLGRRPDAAGLRWWSALLDAGASRADVVARFRAVAEVDQRIARTLVVAYLDREPTAEELLLWTGYLGAGGTMEEVVELLLASPAYLADAGGAVDGFVDQVHRDLLGRPATPAEVAAGRATADRYGRAAAARAVLAGQESRERRIDRLYEALLGRASDAAGRAHWTARLANGSSMTDLLFSMAATAEYAGRDPRADGPDVLATAVATAARP